MGVARDGGGILFLIATLFRSRVLNSKYCVEVVLYRAATLYTALLIPGCQKDSPIENQDENERDEESCAGGKYLIGDFLAHLTWENFYISFAIWKCFSQL